MSKENKRYLDTITAYFNTKWSIIDPETYFKIGFDLFGLRFSYRRFLDKKVMIQYIQYDKLEKRKMGVLEDEIKQSVKFINRFMGDADQGSKLIRYCSMKNGQLSLPVSHYLGGKITKAFMCLLIWYGFFHPTEEELEKMPYVTAHYRDISTSLTKDHVHQLKEIM